MSARRRPTRTKRVLVRRWPWFAIVGALLVLTGAVTLVWLRVDAGDRRAARFEDEATLRGQAVTTLADDVRTLRRQVRAEGATPVVPDPADAIDDLQDRARPPAAAPPPLPGRDGRDGQDGADGRPAPTITPSPGRDGVDGRDGTDGADGVPAPTITPAPGRDGVNGTDGADGKDGRDGTDGTDGKDGAPGPPPSGWTFAYGGTTYRCAPVADGATEYACEPIGEPDPTPSDDEQPDPGGSPLTMAALDPSRRTWP